MNRHVKTLLSHVRRKKRRLKDKKRNVRRQFHEIASHIAERRRQISSLPTELTSEK